MQVEQDEISVYVAAEQLLSDRDQFAIGFAEWKEDSFRYSYNNPLYGRVYVNVNTGTDYAESKLLDLYKQSLNKTDKA